MNRAWLGCPHEKPVNFGLQAKQAFAEGSSKGCKCLEQAGLRERKPDYVMGTDCQGKCLPVACLGTPFST